MSTTKNGNSAPPDRASVEHRLARLLDAPFLARVVPHLAPETLHQLIQYRGLDACGELVTSATPAQLTSLLDLDLWRQAQPGRDEQFDVDRFGEWLEVLVDTGDSVAARTVAALDEHLVIAGLSRYLRVFDPGTFEPTESSDDEPMDRHEMMSSETSADVLECEVGGYLVRALKTPVWDAILTLLVTLENEHDAYFHAVMQGVRRLSSSRPEIDGLDDLLMAPEQHLHDAANDREQRQSRHGYATPADSRAFLRMIRTSGPAAGSATPAAAAVNPIATAYFRAIDEEADSTPSDTPHPAPPGHGGHDSARDDDIRSSINAINDLLVEAGVRPERPRARLETGEEESSSVKLPILRRLMESALGYDESIYLVRTRELAFLANTLLAGCSVQSRPFTPREASDAAACICNLGLECWPARWPAGPPQAASPPREHDTPTPPDAFLVDHGLVAAFEVGWSVLYRDVSLFVADELISTLSDLECVDTEMRRGVRTLRRKLAEQRAAGTPWLACKGDDVLAMLDMTAGIGLLGLLDECPIVPAALTAILERRTTPVSPTAFEFIWTSEQIGDIRLFLRTLPTLLSC